MHPEEPPPATVNITALLITAVVLVLLSMIFSAAESAFLSASTLRIRFLRRKKDKRAMRVGNLLDKREQLINTVIVANNLVNITLTAILTSIAVELFGSGGVGIATAVATIVLLIFGEIAPKTIAASHPEKLSFFFSGFITVIFYVLLPITSIVTKSASLAARCFGVKPAKDKKTFSEDDIKTIMEVGEEEGVLETDEKTMMHRVFKFTDLDAEDIMQPRMRMICVPLQARYRQVVELSQKTHKSRFPVYDEDIDDIVGILYMKDVLPFTLEENTTAFSVKNLMKPPLFIPGSKSMSDIQDALAESNNSICIVLDEYGGTAGLITVEDISQRIFGTFGGETSRVQTAAMEAIESGEISVSGQCRLNELEETCGITFGETEAETIGGFLAEKLDCIPEKGQSVTHQDWMITVEQSTATIVQKVTLSRLYTEAAGSLETAGEAQ